MGGRESEQAGSANVGMRGSTGGGINGRLQVGDQCPTSAIGGTDIYPLVDGKSDWTTPARVFGFWLVSFFLEG